MDKINKEITNFVQTISMKEIRTNPKLKRKIYALLKFIESKDESKFSLLDSSKKGIHSYLNGKVLNK